MRQFAIGDIHGCSVALRRLDEELRFRPSDTVVVLGDVIDVGPDSRGVVDFLLELGTRCRLIAVRGNHEDVMLRARADPEMASRWVLCGGQETLRSYGTSSLKDIPAEHWKFIESTVRFHEVDRDFFVHANADPSRLLADQSNITLYWKPFGHPSRHVSGRRMVCGHSEQRSGRPLDLEHAVCIDTGAYEGGWLTCLETQTDQYWQANQRGDLRQDSLR